MVQWEHVLLDVSHVFGVASVSELAVAVMHAQGFLVSPVNGHIVATSHGWAALLVTPFTGDGAFLARHRTSAIVLSLAKSFSIFYDIHLNCLHCSTILCFERKYELYHLEKVSP